MEERLRYLVADAGTGGWKTGGRARWTGEWVSWGWSTSWIGRACTPGVGSCSLIGSSCSRGVSSCTRRGGSCTQKGGSCTQKGDSCTHLFVICTRVSAIYIGQVGLEVCSRVGKKRLLSLGLVKKGWTPWCSGMEKLHQNRRCRNLRQEPLYHGF